MEIEKNNPDSVIDRLLSGEYGEVVNFYPSLAHIAGRNLKAGILLSYFYHHLEVQPLKTTHQKSYWFALSSKKIEDAIGLSRHEQVTARKHLKGHNFIREDTPDLPRSLFFQVNFGEINRNLIQLVEERLSKMNKKNDSEIINKAI